tara:strand:- start:296 stop:586 length:291 start_codon:yes stop_codon:yes gene_type:complete
MKLIIKKSDKPEKDYMAVFKEGKKIVKTTHFGDSKLPHYTSGATDDQRERYIARHKKDLETNDSMRAGYLSFYILWGDSKSIRKNIKAFKERFGYD